MVMLPGGQTNTQLRKSRGRIVVQQGRIALNVPLDLCNYYRQLIYWEFPNLIGGLSLARHRPHITIGNPKLHKINQAAANKYNEKKVDFEFDPTTIYIGGFAKGFVGFYVKIISSELDKIKNDVILSELSPGSLHLTICSSKHLL